MINEKSPYLLQHAENPVDWYPWGNRAFEKAKKEDKPIFLSIGYSTCHWCHVMAHESFEDSEVAKLMNEVFISIKVDREERPDIDNIYMTACQMMTGSGGWPLTIIMTPDKKPFFSGTYFPKKNRFGRIGLVDLILRIKNLWNTEKDEVLKSADQITFSLQNISNEAPGDRLDEKTIKKAYNQLVLQFDNKYGGFSNRPKFPTPHNLIFLLRFWRRTSTKDALEMVEKTLQKMRKGGIYDHIGFGFHRYSTDEHWLVPHFEKMLYDQALIALAYTETYEATKNPEYSKTAREIFAYVLRDMTSPEGGFYSAEDADSEGIEGKFYVWSVEELKNILSYEKLQLLEKVFNTTIEGNFNEEASNQKTGKNIFYIKDSIVNIANDNGLTEQELRIKMESIREKLFRVRETRIHPYKDDKILLDWNGLMIAALARGSLIYCEPLYLEAAKKAINFILSNLRKQNGRLLHQYRDAVAEIDAYLKDYAFFIWGLIEMYEATFDTVYLKTALELNNDLIDHFWDAHNGGFYFTSDDGEALLTRQKEIYDGAIPSGNSISMLNLLRLSFLTGDHNLKEKAEIISRVFAERINSTPMAYTQFMVAVDFAVGPSYSLVIAGDTGANDTNNMLEEIRNSYIPNKILIHRPTEHYPPKIDEFTKFIEYFDKVDDKATAFVCINKTCKPPTTDINKMLEYLKVEDN